MSGLYFYVTLGLFFSVILGLEPDTKKEVFGSSPEYDRGEAEDDPERLSRNWAEDDDRGDI